MATLGWLTATVAAAAAEGLSPPEAAALASHHEIVLVDVRTPPEWAATGVPAEAATVSWGRPDFAERILALVHGDHAAPVVLICRTGHRSDQAVADLAAHGFTAARDVPEGMAGSAAGPGWLRRGLPLHPWPAD